ncbi:MFS transporter [Vulcaniibacterium tengchongense]|uniref:CP family cyanate transporter-like MFS transporter n=1 Tax=Vulcaniibacterium tengchongense TaxID=1273429 RepID=A0A3N4VAC3_9GAMM|nr:MFS transporter [Vulcaniibacterium tengchongense]RPE79942.1 CP family cyanate transporter-like MFS transporter [Vulcaniibacterium tengchongense]
MDVSPAAVAVRPRWRERALVLAGIVLSAFNLRTAVTSLTPLLDQLGREFGFGPTMTGVFGMAPTAAFALFGVATPGIAHRLGLERTALLAMALAAAGLLARAFAGDAHALLAASALALSGMGMGNVVLPPLVKRYFADRVGTVSTLYIAVLQVGTILPALFAVPLAHAAGWRTSLGAWSLVAAAAALPWLGVLWMERRGRSRQARTLARLHDAAVAPHDEAPELARAETPGKVWRSPVAWGLMLMFGNTSLVTYSMFTWLPKLLIEAGGSAALGGAMVALFSTLGLVSALLLPALAVRIANPFPIVLGCVAAYLVAFAGLLWAPMDAPMLWVALLGLGPSTFPLSLTLINLRTRTQAGSSRLSGFVQGAGYALSCLGPLLFGWLHERSGGWGWPFAFLLLCLVALTVGGRMACRPRLLEDTW